MTPNVTRTGDAQEKPNAVCPYHAGPFLSRGGRIRTGDLLLPKQARYRAAPRPVVLLLQQLSTTLQLAKTGRVQLSVQLTRFLIALPPALSKLATAQDDFQHSRLISLLVA